MTAIDEFAPYPKTLEDVTADGLARCMAVSAHVGFGRMLDTAPAANAAERELWRVGVARMCAEYGVVRLLRELRYDRADQVARELWSEWDDGEPVGTRLWEWLHDYGIDPDEVPKAAEKVSADRDKTELGGVSAVRNIHRPIAKTFDDDASTPFTACLECDGIREAGNDEAGPVTWPCPTIQALDGEQQSAVTHTNHHKTVNDLRRELAAASERWRTVSEPYFDAVTQSGVGDTKASPANLKSRDATRDAFAGSVMAMNYAYTLAAVLEVAQRDFGEDVARRLAFEVEENLPTADFDDLGTDVTPEPERATETTDA